MGPQNGLVGDEFGMDIPVSEVPQDQLVDVTKRARFSKSKEFAKLKEHLTDRIEYYQSFLPGNVPVIQISDDERGKYWAVADVVINEFRAVIDAYEGAEKELADARRKDSSAI